VSVLGAALVPAAPVLIPELSGQMMPAAAPTEAARAALARLINANPEQLVVVAEGDRDAEFGSSAQVGLHRLGGLPRLEDPDAVAAEELPLPLAIGAALLGQLEWAGPTSYRLVDRSISSAEAAEHGRQLDQGDSQTGLVLLGSGSARSTEKAPGSLDPNAAQFNQDLLRMIKQGDANAISQLSAEASEGQMSDIRVPLQLLAGVASLSPPAGEVGFADEFKGVYYLCATFLP
jgi:hypothetical protein